MVEDKLHDGRLILTWNGPTIHESQITTLEVKFQLISNAIFRIKITDSAKVRYEVPLKLDIEDMSDHNEPLYELVTAPLYTNFWFYVKRKSSQEILFDTRNTVLVFLDSFIELTSSLPSDRLYGLGERGAPFRRIFDYVKMPLFAHDNYPSPIGQNINLYSSQPFYMVVESDGGTHGVMIYNSNAMEMYLTPVPAITMRLMGGIIDLFFFLGPTPLAVTEQLTDVIGKPFMPPLWSLGFHLCRYNYSSLEKTKTVFNRNWNGGMYMDVQWQDIDYMDKFLIFTVDGEKYKGLKTFVDEEVHGKDLHYVMIVDPAVGVEQGFDVYERGLFKDIYIKNITGQVLVGKVWPGPATFPDFTNDKAAQWWSDELVRFHNQVPFDGIWLDMNEPASFVAGSVDGCEQNPNNYPIYKPNTAGDEIFHKTLCMDARQKKGLHKDLHNIYGITETTATYASLEKLFPSKRPFIISRSTFLGSGKYGGHWLGDNQSNYKHLRQSIIGILDFGIFGIPMVGADIGGFAGDCDEQLAIRWHQLGAWYPFCRNHNDNTAEDQDPAHWSPDAFEKIKTAIGIRYDLLFMWYTFFYEAHVSGLPIVRATFQNFPNNTQLFNKNFDDMFTQFMVGSNILVAPIVKEDILETDVYLPDEAIWYQHVSDVFTKVPSGKRRVYVPLSELPYFVRGGTAIFKTKNGQNTANRNNSTLSITLLPDANNFCEGYIYLDDGLHNTPNYGMVRFSATIADSGIKIPVVVFTNGNYIIRNEIDELRIYGVDKQVSKIVVDGTESMDFEQKEKTLKITKKIAGITKSFDIDIHYK